MTEPHYPPQPVPLVPAGDNSTSLWGGTFLPLAPDPQTGDLPAWAEHYALLRDADPARFATIDFLAWMIQLDVGQRLAQEAAQAGIKIPYAVNSVSTVDPAPFFSANGVGEFRFPLLALYRRKSVSSYVSVAYPVREGSWELRYVLPEMGIRVAEKLEPILHAVEAAIENAVYWGYHPQYTPPFPGAVAGNLVFQLAGLMEIETDEAEWEHVALEGEGAVHLSYKLTLKVKVRKMDVVAPMRGAPVPFTGIDLSVTTDAVAGSSEAIPSASPVEIVQSRTDVPLPKDP